MLPFRVVRVSLPKLTATVILIAWSVVAAWTQCAPLRGDAAKLPAREPLREPLMPESGYLSNSTYTNSFFGFALDLPITSQGHLVRLPLLPERQHALLAIAFQNGDRSGSLTINAIDPREHLEGFTAQPQQPPYAGSPSAVQPGAQVEPQTQPQISPQGTLVAPQVRPGAPKFHIPAERFHSSERHKGENYTALYRTEIKNYRVGVLIATNDKDFLQKSKQAMAAMLFYCTADDGTLATKEGDLVTPEGERYEGPTVPTWRADAAIQTNRGLAIPPGEVADRVYRNSALDFEYEIPEGWVVLPTHNGGNPPADLSWLREFQFLHACSRTLLRIQQSGAADAGSSRPPMIILRALDPTCLSMRIPTALSEARTAEEIGVSLETLVEFGQVASHELVSLSGQLFMVFHGTIAAPAEGEQLAQRMSQTMFGTNHNHMLLLWSFMAPTGKELRTMPTNGIRLGPQPIELGSALAAKQ
jgi:hypothetical protein